MTARIDLRSRALGIVVADAIREARTLVGWSQRELAARAGTSQATVWRIETDRAGRLDARVVERILAALGLRPTLELNDRHLEDRRRQRDLVHAILNPQVDRRLRRAGWQTRTEVQIGDPEPRGWIDTLAYREADHALLVEETKTDLPDMGALQRTLTFYDRAAWATARRFGWHPRSVHVLVVCLDTTVVRQRLAANRTGLATAFPGRADAMHDWLRDPSAPPPRGWTLTLTDPASRSARWLRAGIADRRLPAPYEDYASAARTLPARDRDAHGPPVGR
ncbi:MAG TPA: helix-turn-helix transcriptional regulator [Candidatus Limnocylindrales bacterium]|nr:helix-turn-helix transcriptional regulator [Candidatus Limnocylindrales bacterium]